MQTAIYILICPIDGHVKYVGKSNDPVRRLKDHMLDFRVRLGEFRKVKWLSDLHKKNMKPQIQVVDVVDTTEWKYWEKWWIQYMRSLGFSLFNDKRGGNGLTMGNNQTFKKGNVPWNLGLTYKKKRI